MVMNLKWLGVGAIALAAASVASAQTWRQVGPPGGTVISLEADPHDTNKLYLGHIGWARIQLDRRGRALATAEPHRHRPGRRRYTYFGGPARLEQAVCEHVDTLFGRRRRLSQQRCRSHVAGDRAGA